MPDDLRATLEAAIDETVWTPLAMHAKRDALFLVDPAIGLLTAALAIAQDRQAIVAQWIASGMLRRPTPAERASWDAAAESTTFRFVIVQPYVLAMA